MTGEAEAPRGGPLLNSPSGVRAVEPGTRVSGSTALYRYFDDKRRLLYIGISGNHWTRTLSHASKSGWMDLATSSTIVRHPTRREALEAEYAAIRDERPLFNWQHNDTAEAQARLQAYLAEIGRMDLFVRRTPGTGGTGELGQSGRPWQWNGCDLDFPHGPCLDDAETEFDHRIGVDHGLDRFGQPVTPSGIVIVHAYDGKECTEVYLYAAEARELAAALTEHANESVTFKAEDESRCAPSAIARQRRRHVA